MILYIVATPIGNLKDITLRALETLKSADFVLAEDTRVTKKLLSHYDIRAPLISYHEHSGPKAYKKIEDMLKNGKKLALVSDAGTPGISDPGARLISYLLENLSDIKIVPIPGASALTAALSVSGINLKNGFCFLGYPPHKKGRKKFFETCRRSDRRPLVLYESPHRIEKTLKELAEIKGENHGIIIMREMTKIHEEIFRGTIKETQNYLNEQEGERKKGEFVLIIL